jgi:hypothetical protein
MAATDSSSVTILRQVSPFGNFNSAGAGVPLPSLSACPRSSFALPQVSSG